MASVIFNEGRLKKAIQLHGEKVVKKFSASTFKMIVKTSPQKDTFSDSGAYRRTGTFRDGWDIKRAMKGYKIFNEVSYAPYYEYGHRIRGGGVAQGAYLMKHAVEKNLRKFNLTARKEGL